MAPVITWQITALDCIPQTPDGTDYVVTAHWSCNGTDGTTGNEQVEQTLLLYVPSLTVTSLTGYMYANNNSPVTASTTIPNSGLANSNVVLGNTTIVLGSTVTSVGNLTLSNVTVGSGNVTANLSSTNTTAASATFATSSLPLVPEGYIVISIGGSLKKIPYYGV